MTRARDLAGQTFGSWTVLRRGPSKKLGKSTYSTWECRCCCGVKRRVLTKGLVGGTSTSCRCQSGTRALDLTGLVFDSLTVLGRSPDEMNNDGRGIRWRCRCKCGQEKHVRGSTLKQGRSTSCGCESRARWRQRALEQFNVRLEDEAGRPVHRYYLNTARLGAEERGIDFDLTREQIEELLVKQGFRCAITGQEIGFAAHELPTSCAGRDTTASLNRIDATRGFTIDNVLWCHKDIGGMKMDLPMDRFVDLCRMVARAAT